MSFPMTFTYETSRKRLAQIVQLLQQSAGGLTRDQLAAKTGLNAHSLYSYLRHLAGAGDAPRQIRIGAWNRQLGRQGNFEPVYFAGAEPDTPKPTPLSVAERGRRHRANLKKQGEVHKCDN